jgi:hypothetical protein
MTLRHRTLARAGAAIVGLFAAGALAAPAYAGTATDLELTVAGTKVAAGSEGKVGWVKITNKGEGTPTALTVAADLSDLDPEKMVALPAGEDCEADEAGPKITCSVPADDIPGPGETLEFPVLVLRNPEVAGPYTGHVTFTISSPDDTTPDNNSKTVEVAISERSGVDLGVIAPDVKNEIDLAESTSLPAFTEDAIHPGDTSAVLGFAINQGDMTATGVKVSVTLPKQVTFAEKEEGCTYSADTRTVTCNYEQVSLIPADKDTDGNDDVSAFAVIWFPIKVAEGVTAPVALTGGTFGAAALGQVEFEEQASTLSTEAAPKLPANVKLLGASDVPDVDPSDNVDGFAVIVAAEGGGGGGDGDEDGGPTLPVTGVQVGLIGGLGAGVIAVGGVLVLLARRRRVILVTPDDERPTA